MNMPNPDIKIVPVKRFQNSLQANLYKAKLKSEGIESFLTNEHLLTLSPCYLKNLDLGIDSMVKEDDYQKALEIINDNTTEISTNED